MNKVTIKKVSIEFHITSDSEALLQQIANSLMNCNNVKKLRYECEILSIVTLPSVKGEKVSLASAIKAQEPLI